LLNLYWFVQTHCKAYIATRSPVTVRGMCKHQQCHLSSFQHDIVCSPYHTVSDGQSHERITDCCIPNVVKSVHNPRCLKLQQISAQQTHVKSAYGHELRRQNRQRQFTHAGQSTSHHTRTRCCRLSLTQPIILEPNTSAAVKVNSAKICSVHYDHNCADHTVFETPLKIAIMMQSWS